MALEFDLTFAGVPFLGDSALSYRVPDGGSTAARKQLAEVDLLAELDRRIPFHYLHDFKPPASYPGKNLGAIAYPDQMESWPNPQVRINDWYYPTGMSRWSVFRGLATSSQVKKILETTGGTSAATFVMKCNPASPGNPALDSAGNYTLSTSMRMLPARPLGEHGSEFDGLYLVTLVDERYYLQNTPVSLKPTHDTTWTSLLTSLASALGISLSFSSLAAAYGRPEIDSQLWTNQEDAALLLDAVAANLGRVVVRLLGGTYVLRTPSESVDLVRSNRATIARTTRTAGGELFLSGTATKAGDLRATRNAVVPATISVTFPAYVHGDDPVPHFLNTRYPAQRPTGWYEDSYGAVYTISVPIASGGSLVSGLTGVSSHALHTTAKALLDTEASTTPANLSGITSLALQVAQDYWGWQAGSALDEVYVGTFAWVPEGFHDLIWTFRTRSRLGSTRVMRTEWNTTIREFQHAAPALSGGTSVTAGVGGHSVAQTIRDSFSGTITSTVSGLLSTSGTTVTFSAIDYFPTQNRWRGQIENEVILFEGTSGGINVGVVYRGIDGTIPAEHSHGSVISFVAPNTTYGANLITHEKGAFAYPADWTSGGIQGVNLVPQTQSVTALTGSGVLIRDIYHYSGRVQLYDTTQASGSEFRNRELCWVVDRNAVAIRSGRMFDGVFGGFSASGPVAPVYIVSEDQVGGGASLMSGSVQSGHAASGLIQGFFGVTRHIASGTVGVDDFGSGAVVAGTVGSGAIQSGNIASGQLGSFHYASGSVVSGRLGVAGTPTSGYLVAANPDDPGGFRWAAPGAVTLTSGAVQSGHAASGLIQGFFGATRHIASGTVGVFDFGSGAAVAGTVGSGAIVSGNVASGVIGLLHIASGAVGSGRIGNAAVLSGGVGSGQIGQFQVSSGAVTSGRLGTAGTPTSGNYLTANPDGAGGFRWVAPPAVSACRLQSPSSSSGNIDFKLFDLSGGYNAIPWDAELYDTDSYHSISVSNTLVVIPSTDIYHVNSQLTYYTDPPGVFSQSGRIVLGYKVDGGSDFIEWDEDNLTENWSGAFGHASRRCLGGCFDFNFNSGQTFEVGALVNGLEVSGVSISLVGTWLAVHRIGGTHGNIAVTSGGIQSGLVASGAIQGFFGATRHIASGTIGVSDFGSGAVIAGTVGSGAVRSGNVASGSVGRFHLDSTYKAIVASLPASPVEGQLVIHSGTGRIWEMLYLSGAWETQESYGPSTIYVHTSGTDTIANGTTSGTSSYRTLTYALGTARPKRAGGTITINCGPGIISGNPVAQGITAGGNYTIEIIGQLHPYLSGQLRSGDAGDLFTGTRAVLGTGATSLSGTAGMILKFDAATATTALQSVARPIDLSEALSGNTGIVHLALTLPAAPVSGDRYVIFSSGAQATVLHAVSGYGFRNLNGPMPVNVTRCIISTSGQNAVNSVQVDAKSISTFTECILPHGVIENYDADVKLNESSITGESDTGVSQAVGLGGGTHLQINRSRVVTGDDIIGVDVAATSEGLISDSVIRGPGQGPSTTYGVHGTTVSLLQLLGVHLAGWDTGFRADLNGVVTGTSFNGYTDCTQSGSTATGGQFT